MGACLVTKCYDCSVGVLPWQRRGTNKGAHGRKQAPKPTHTAHTWSLRVKTQTAQYSTTRPPWRGSTSSAATLSWREDRLYLSSEPGVQGTAMPALKNGLNATVFSLP